MKIKKVFICLPLIAAGVGHAQIVTAKFSFLSGTTQFKAASYPPSYGVLGAAYTPGIRDSHKIAFYNGSVYTFHGSQSSAQTVNDVWSLDVVNSTWKWIAGKSNDPSRLGSLRTARVTNTPGFRFDFCGDLHQERRQYILHGGGINYMTSDFLSDLWTFDLGSNIWTWLAGPSSANQAASYVTGLTPGARSLSVCSVYQPTGEFLLFGGQSPSGSRGDVWAFSLVSFTWSFISGTSTPAAPAAAGLRGVWSTRYYIGARFGAGLAFDTISNITYIYGGFLSQLFGDLWGFRRDSLHWALITDSSATVYGSMGRPSQINFPGSRRFHAMAYHEQSRSLVLYGGSSLLGGAFGDLWAFSTESTMWTWIGGSSSPNSLAVYSGESVKPAAHTYSSISVDQNSGSVLMFGGYGTLTSPTSRTHDNLWDIEILIVTNTTRSSSGVLTRSSGSISSSRAYSLMTVSVSKNFFSTEMPPTSYNIASSFISNEEKFTFSPSDSILGADIESDSRGVIETSSRSLLRASAFRMSSKLSYLSTNNSGFGLPTSPTQFVLMLVVILLANIVIIYTAWKCRKHFVMRAANRAKEKEVFVKFSYSENSIASSSEQPATNMSSISQTMVDSTDGIYIPGGLLIETPDFAFQIEKEIARGGGGSVSLATAFDIRLRAYGPQVIVKAPNKELKSDRSIALFHQEIALINAFKSHKNIVKLLGYTENPYTIILKYYPHGSLARWIQSKQRSRNLGFIFSKDIAQGLQALHSSGIVHCDLKPDNILIDKLSSALCAVISDFGIAQIVSRTLLNVGAYQAQTAVGHSLKYSAPETLAGLKSPLGTALPIEVVKKRDIYALGLVVYAILDGEGPWH